MQVRNAVMACGLFGTACAYIGARALPDLLLNDEYMKNLDSLAVRSINMSCHADLFQNGQPIASFVVTSQHVASRLQP